MKNKPGKAPSNDKPLFMTWGKDDQAGLHKAMVASSNSITRANAAVYRTTASGPFSNIAPGNVSIRDGFDKRDYDYFRPGERTPRTQLEIVMASMSAYDKVGLVRNVIDMMADFATQGIDLEHRNVGIEQWYKAWFMKVGGKERTERFLNTVLRAGTSVVQRHTAKIKVKDEETLLRGLAANGDDAFEGKVNLQNREIPWGYTIHNPLQLEVLNGELAIFAGPGGLTYGLRIPAGIIKQVNYPKTGIEKQLIARLPKEIQQAIKDGLKVLPLNSEKIVALYYKRDDWDVWAKPLITAVLSDLQMYNKLKLADMAALDGAISHIRLWKLGSLKDRLLPTEHAIARLAEMLTNNVGGGCMDLIWGPELSLEETDTSLHQFLGSPKYAPHLEAIYAGLGIPPTLTGSGGSGSGFTNNFISLRTLTERLQYIRDIAIKFWRHEIGLVQKAMGFRYPAHVTFDRLSLTDEAAEKQLLINLVDRGILSEEAVLKHFDEIPEIEDIRRRREEKERESGKRTAKAGPFNDPQEKFALRKIALQTGSITPSEVGLELEEKKPGETSVLDKQAKIATKQAKIVKGKSSKKKKGQPGQGRPKNTKDSGQRKKKTVKPRTAASFVQTVSWAEQAQASIIELVSPVFLKSIGKKNRRQLTETEFDQFEKFTFSVLCNLPQGTEVTEAAIKTALSKPLSIPLPIDVLNKATRETLGADAPIEKVRQAQAQVYALYHTDLDDGV